LRVGIALLSSLAKPKCSLSIVLVHALAVVAQNSKSVLSLGIALLGSLAKPKGRLGVVLRNALAVVV
jgi:hypothetical protein